MEVGTKFNSITELRAAIEKGDLDLSVKAGIIIQGRMGTVVAIRKYLEEFLPKCNGSLIYFTITGQPLYIVQFNDLCEAKQKQLEARARKMTQ